MPLAVCATPIGNLGDVTLRVLEELREADLVLCEDTRQTRVLLDRHGIAPRAPRSATIGTTRPAAWPRCCHDSSRASAWRSSRMRACPGSTIRGRASCAPRSMRACAVTVLPGPSAVETALVASGLAGDQYRFLGWLPAARDGAGRAVGGARPPGRIPPSRSSRRRRLACVARTPGRRRSRPRGCRLP